LPASEGRVDGTLAPQRTIALVSRSIRTDECVGATKRFRGSADARGPFAANALAGTGAIGTIHTTSMRSRETDVACAESLSDSAGSGSG
jgi:hypothetical protein